MKIIQKINEEPIQKILKKRRISANADFIAWYIGYTHQDYLFNEINKCEYCKSKNITQHGKPRSRIFCRAVIFKKLRDITIKIPQYRCKECNRYFTASKQIYYPGFSNAKPIVDICRILHIFNGIKNRMPYNRIEKRLMDNAGIFVDRCTIKRYCQSQSTSEMTNYYKLNIKNSITDVIIEQLFPGSSFDEIKRGYYTHYITLNKENGKPTIKSFDLARERIERIKNKAPYHQIRITEDLQNDLDNVNEKPSDILYDAITGLERIKKQSDEKNIHAILLHNPAWGKKVIRKSFKIKNKRHYNIIISMMKNYVTVSIDDFIRRILTWHLNQKNDYYK